MVTKYSIEDLKLLREEITVLRGEAQGLRVVELGCFADALKVVITELERLEPGLRHIKVTVVLTKPEAEFEKTKP